MSAIWLLTEFETSRALAEERVVGQLVLFVSATRSLKEVDPPCQHVHFVSSPLSLLFR
jgi:hypothetical protein